MTPRKRWFALLGATLVASLAAVASAQPKGAPAHAEAGKKHPAPGTQAGPAGPPPSVGRGPAAEGKDKAADKAKDKDKAADKAKDKDKAADKAKDKDKAADKAKDKDKAADKAKDKDKAAELGQGEDKGEHEAKPPRPPGPPDGTLRRPPDHRVGHGPAPNPELRKKWQQRRADQMKRRRAQLQDLRERWGQEQLAKPEVKAAIKVHAWRMARLKRIRELALQDPDGSDLVEKTDKLIEKEQERFQLQMARMKTGSDVGTIGDGGIAPAVLPPVGAKQPPSTAGKKEGAAPADKPSTAGKKEGAK